MDQSDHKGDLDLEVNEDHQEAQVETVLLVDLERKVQEVQEENEAQLVQQVLQVDLVQKVQLDLEEVLVHLDHQV